MNEEKWEENSFEQADQIPKELPTSSVLSVSDRVVYPSESKKGANGEEFQISVMAEEAQLTPEQEPFSFRTPQKRKMKNKVLDAKISKTTELRDEDTQEMESDSDSSECSESFSQGEASVRSYDLEDIKLFLRATQNKRGVKVQEYFPDLVQFVDRAKSWIACDSFTNKEVYRLKKIVRNINIAHNNDVE